MCVYKQTPTRYRKIIPSFFVIRHSFSFSIRVYFLVDWIFSPPNGIVVLACWWLSFSCSIPKNTHWCGMHRMTSEYQTIELFTWCVHQAIVKTLKYFNCSRNRTFQHRKSCRVDLTIEWWLDYCIRIWSELLWCRIYTEVVDTNVTNGFRKMAHFVKMVWFCQHCGTFISISIMCASSFIRLFLSIVVVFSVFLRLRHQTGITFRRCAVMLVPHHVSL